MHLQHKLYLKRLIILACGMLVWGCTTEQPEVEPPNTKAISQNPFLTELNEPIDYASVNAEHLTAYGETVLEQSQQQLATIKTVAELNFESIV
ncbi:MAG: hypothetical protein KJO69_03165, partial [Gammaproteobacteria bacterium]|nr:hypothetical protein [Gammaproteobacteria bacterium]